MAQKIDEQKLYLFLRDNHNDHKKFICANCKKKSKQTNVCAMNNIKYLNYEKNTCSKFEAKDE